MPRAEKNPDAVRLGRLGGQKTGRMMAERLTPAQRSDRARWAARARWGGQEAFVAAREGLAIVLRMKAVLEQRLRVSRAARVASDLASDPSVDNVEALAAQTIAAGEMARLERLLRPGTYL